MGWASGELNLLSSSEDTDSTEEVLGTSSSSRLRRRLLGNNGTSPLLPPGTPRELISLLNTLLTLAIAVAFTTAIQLLVVLLWKHGLNRRFYREKMQTFPSEPYAKAPSKRSTSAQLPTHGAKSRISFDTPSRIAPSPPASPPDSTSKRSKAARFLPFPKQFVWPGNLIFVLAAFSTGLTRTSTTLLASQPLPRCQAGCLATGIVTLVMLAVFLCLVILDFVQFRKAFSSELYFERAKRATKLKEVTDPIMWLKGEATLACLGIRFMLPCGKQPAQIVQDSEQRTTHASLSSPKPASATPEASCRASDSARKMPRPSLRHAPSFSQQAEKFIASRKLARARAHDLVEKRSGFPNRPSGAFNVPSDGMMEPERTERLLAHPFALWRSVPGDAYHQRVSFTFFRVNGTTRIGLSFRILVLIANIFTGALGGLSPLMTTLEMSVAQAAIILAVQLGMALVCFYFRPDADKIFSIFAGTQFLMEGLVTACSLWSALVAPELRPDVHALGFTLSLVGVFVPMIQLVEQRLFTPLVGGIRVGGCRASVVLGIIAMIAISAPRIMRKALKMIACGDDGDDGNDGDGGDDGGVGDGDGRDDDNNGGGGGSSSSGDGGLQPDVGDALTRAGQKYLAAAAKGDMKTVEVTTGPEASALRRKNGIGDQGEGDDGGDGD